MGMYSIRVRHALTFIIVAVLVSTAWMSFGVHPSAASPGAETGVTDTGSLDAMHAACASGNIDAMHGIMESMTDEDWDAMDSHMGSGMMSSGMMGSASHETTTMDTRRW